MDKELFETPPDEMGFARLKDISNNLDRIFRVGKWQHLELETISLELGKALDTLTRDKIFILQYIKNSKELFFNDVLFFLHATDVINNNIAEFDNFPFPSSLEIAFAWTEIINLVGIVPCGNPILKTISYILNQEGYSVAVWPFDIIGVKDTDLHPGQTEQDTNNKEVAITKYIKGLRDAPRINS